MGLPGIALLLLRTTVGLTMLIRDGACLAEAADRPVVYVASALGILAGGLLLVGFLTTFAGIGGGMVAMLTAFKVLPICSSGGFAKPNALSHVGLDDPRPLVSTTRSASIFSLSSEPFFDWT